MSELEIHQRRCDRERAARKEAEALLEAKSREVFAANQQLQALAEHTRAIVENAAEGIITYDARGCIGSINRSARMVFDIKDTGDIGNLNVNQLLKAQDLQCALFPAAPADAQPRTHDLPTPVEVTGVGLDNRTFVAEISVSSMLVGDCRTYTAMIRDLSQRKLREEQLRHAKKMESIGQMAAGLAHEINTPIQFVGNNIQFLEGAFEDLGELLDLFQKLKKAVKSDADAQQLLDEIETQSELVDLPFLRNEFPDAIKQSLEGIERVAAIVRAMKEYSTPSSENKTSVDLHCVVEAALSDASTLCRDVVDIETVFDRTIPSVPLVEAKVHQAILHVIANSADAIAGSEQPGQGKVRIATAMTANSIELQICDNGPGIPLEIQDRIFDPFFTTKEVGQGIGQGLAFVYDVVVNKHDGSIRVVSVPGTGTTFFLTFPIPPQEGTNSARRAHENSIG